MKKIILSSALLLACLAVFSQDKIYLRTGESLETKVIEIGEKDISYKKFENVDGPSYTLKIRDVFMIVYESGKEEVFNPASGRMFNQNQNVVSLNYGDITFLRAAISYERLFYNSHLGIKIPFALSIDDDQDFFGDGNPLFKTGFDFNFYPLGQRKLAYYTGLGMRTGISHYDNCYYEYDDILGYGDWTCTFDSNHWFVGSYVNNGLILNFTDVFSINGMLGLGFLYEERYSGVNPHVIGEMSASFRF